MIAQWLATADEWVIAALLLAGLFAAAEAGFRLARRRGAARDDGAAALWATMQASVLGLLALLLGFTFAAARLPERAARAARLVEGDANGDVLVQQARRTGAVRLGQRRARRRRIHRLAQGGAERRNLRATLLVTALIGSVIILILDLDRPATGVVRLSAQALADLKASVGSQSR